MNAALQELSLLDRAIINRLQDGIPVCEAPYAELAGELGTDETTLLRRLQALKTAGYLSRIGPMYNVERMGGAFTLAALQVPDARFDEVAGIVNVFPEVAHNYRRDHAFNMWFVVAVAEATDIASVLSRIKAATGLEVYNFPKQEEFYLRLKFDV
ncbi:Lrp/AsnC family transcriptional regulator [Thiohalobacter thiocyanaticus]|uniref:siroheme decarboxylase n=1 Tax=Thiohalobacter thiocyanaticus TaxID=585455 RepID=A0A426QJ12_9GAMM|nr:AsnC family transcriptional regulator [Thiohalobacter thiocyanaticus]RRQ21743.1 Lrp/AsnC family transcriptional regulator [Thiohalobacter thiocyanaticus]